MCPDLKSRDEAFRKILSEAGPAVSQLTRRPTPKKEPVVRKKVVKKVVRPPVVELIEPVGPPEKIVHPEYVKLRKEGPVMLSGVKGVPLADKPSVMKDTVLPERDPSFYGKPHQMDVSHERQSVLLFKLDNPDVNIPKGRYGDFDVVTTTKKTVPDDLVPFAERYGTGPDVSTVYSFGYSDKSQHKIDMVGSVDDYDKYLNMVRSHPELVAIYNLSGGKGVGPFGIIPSMGVDLALASNKPGITGASEREEVLIQYLHRQKGGADKGPSVAGLGRAIIESPYVQLAAGEAIPVLTAAAARGAVRVAPRVLSKLPGLRTPVSRLVGATGRIAGKKAVGDITKTTVGRHFLRWAQEGAVPVVKTTPKVIASSHTVKKLFSGSKATSYIDELGNVVLKSTNKPIGYLDDFNRVILYKPKRTWGFVEREFISKAQAKKYADLLKKGITPPEYVQVLRGQKGQNPWAQFQAIAEQSGYKKKLLRGVKYPYRSKSLEISFADYPSYIPDEALLSESEAIKRAILRGKVPGRDYGSLYNVQSFTEPSDIARGIGPEFFKARKGSGWLTVAKERLLPTKMKNVWASKRWNPFTQEWDDVASASLLRQPGTVTPEERAIIRQLKEGGTLVGKGRSVGSAVSQFAIPVESQGFNEFLMFLGFRPLVYGKKPLSKQDYIQMVEQQQKQMALTLRPPGQIRPPRQIVDQTQDVWQENIQRQHQAQRQAQRTIVPLIQETVSAPAGISRVRKPSKPKRAQGYMFPEPPLPFFWFPPMGGRVAGGRGRAMPYDVKYINEYELVQKMMRDVIF